MTLVSCLERWARERPDKRAFTFLGDGEREQEVLDYRALEARTRAIAGLLSAERGSRALLVYPSGLAFVEAFLGCLRAGVIPCPLYPPDPARPSASLNRLRAVARDAGASLLLTTAATLPLLDPVMPSLGTVRCVATDQAGESVEPGFAPEDDALAFLQYTSGSTSDPKGVMVAHDNLLHNLGVISDVFGVESDSVVVSWLPLFHDMGLIGAALVSLFQGATCVLMPPLAFLQQPLRWLRAITHYRGSFGGGPNFGYELCCRRISDEQRASLDLSSWRLAYNGAEPIRGDTLRRFVDRFSPVGLRWEAMGPCYGLAEATLMVTGSRHGVAPVLLEVDSQALGEHRVVLSPGGQPLAGSGRLGPGNRVVIVDGERACAPGEVGEIWTAGPSVARGYWARPDDSERFLKAHLGADGPFLRTGDLGFFHDGELFVTGRIKDLIIVAGRNHYPQDIELTVEGADASVRSGCVAAFALPADDGSERVGIAVEVDGSFDRKELVRKITSAVVEAHELQVQAVHLAPPRSLPKTSSGKIMRQACRTAFLSGTLASA